LADDALNHLDGEREAEDALFHALLVSGTKLLSSPYMDENSNAINFSLRFFLFAVLFVPLHPMLLAGTSASRAACSLATASGTSHNFSNSTYSYSANPTTLPLSLDEGSPSNAWSLYFNLSIVGVYGNDRCNGYSVRPVQSK